jgi:hypothetical protein
MQRCALRSAIVLAVAMTAALPLSVARAQKDLTPEPTTKGDPTTKDLPPGSTTLTPTPTGPKTGKPPPAPAPTESASASASASESAEPPQPPPEEPPKAKPAQRSFARKKVPLGVGDLEVSISMPDTWTELPDTALPEVENTEQVTVVTRKGFGVHDPKGKPPTVEEVIVVCGKAAGDYWADAIRDAAFTQMMAAVEKEASAYTTVKTIEPDAIREDSDRLLQSFAADADFSIDGKANPGQLGKGKPKVANTVKLQGLNFIAFHSEADGKTPHIVACSVACAHLVAEGDSVCPAAIGSIEFAGTYAKAPKRSWLAELLFKLKSDPTTMWLGIVGAAFLTLVLVVMMVLVLRKKKPEGAHDDHDDDEFEGGYQAGVAAAEIKSTMHASPPPAEGFFDPQTLTRKKI